MSRYTGGHDGTSLRGAAGTIHPEILDVIDNLAYVYLKRNETARAVTLMRDAANREPGDSRYRLHFAMALKASGNREGAVLELEAAL